MVPDSILGLPIVPLTPARYSILRGIGNAYVTGRVPTEADLRNFVWFCSPQFNPDAPIASLRWKPFVMWRLYRAMRCYLWFKHKEAVITANFFRACRQIHDMVEATFADVPSPGEPGNPIAASYEAQMVNLFSREYQMWALPQPIRHTPIKQLNQLARCIDRHLCGKDDTYFERNEYRATIAFMESINTRN